MLGWFKLVMRWFGDERGELHDWRIGPAVCVMFLPVIVIAAVGLGLSEGLLFVAALATILLLATPVFWLLDLVRCARQEEIRRLGGPIRKRAPIVAANVKRNLKLVTMPVVLATGVFIVVSIFQEVRRDFASPSWPTTVGTSMTSRVTAAKNDEFCRIVRVKVAYKVDGAEHVRWLDATPVNEPLSKDDAKQLARHFDSGTVHRVWYDPRNPSHAKLEPGVDWFKYARNFPPLFLLVGIMAAAGHSFLAAVRNAPSNAMKRTGEDDAQSLTPRTAA